MTTRLQLAMDAHAPQQQLQQPQQQQLGRVLPYVPAPLLAHALPQLRQLSEGAKTAPAVWTVAGAALFLDVSGFSGLARTLARSDAASAAEQLSTTLNAYILQLVSRLHARGAEILFFAGDALVAFVAAGELEGGGRGRTLREAAGLAVEAARDVQSIAFERGGHRLTAHTGIGAGELHLYLLQGSDGAAQLVCAGAVIEQVCEALSAATGDDVVLSEEAHVLLQPACPAERLQLPASGPGPGPGPARRAVHRLRRDRPSTAAAAAAEAVAAGAWAESPGAETRACGCGAPLRAGARAAEAALAPYAEQLLSLAPRAVGEGARWTPSSRTTSATSSPSSSSPPPQTLLMLHCPHHPHPTPPRPPTRPASFPELDGAGLDAYGDPGAVERHAARFGQVVRSVHRVAEELGGSVNKVLLDDKGASAIIGFGLPGGFAHEDDAERAVRAALALQAWFRETNAPFACGIAAGRTFCGTLGAPCRKEYALIGDSVILAARLMGRAREAIGAAQAAGAAGGGPPQLQLQEVLCDRSVVQAATARGRSAAALFEFEALPATRAKGFDEPLPVYRPREAPSITSRGGGGGGLAPSASNSRRLSAVGDGGGLVRAGSGSGSGAAAATHQHPAPLLGRDGELAEATAAVEALAAGGQGSTLVIEGEAGVGKSRLLLEVRRACAATAVLVLSSTASSVEEATPLWALRGLVASVADVSSEAALRADLERRRLLTAADAALIWRSLFAGGGGGGGGGGAASSSASAAAAAARQQLGDGNESGSTSYRGREASTRRGISSFGVGLVTSLAAALARLVLDLEHWGEPVAGSGGGGEEGGPAGARVAMLLEDCHWLDSVSWFVVRCIRDSCPNLLLVLTARPMADPPRDFLVLSGRLEAPSGPWRRRWRRRALRPRRRRRHRYPRRARRAAA
eukprot:tig00000624_g2651.t1